GACTHSRHQYALGSNGRRRTCRGTSDAGRGFSPIQHRNHPAGCGAYRTHCGGCGSRRWAWQHSWRSDRRTRNRNRPHRDRMAFRCRLATVDQLRVSLRAADRPAARIIRQSLNTRAINTMAYATHLLITFNIFVLLAASLDLLVGFTGLLSLAHAIFFGIGAYATALLSKSALGPVPAALIGMSIAATASIFITFPSIWVRGIYLIIVTIAVQVVFTVILLNWTDLTGGAAGISNIPPFSLGGHVLRGAELL